VTVEFDSITSVYTLPFRLHYFLLYYFVFVSSMELLGSMQDGATRPVTGPPLRRSPEVSDPQDPVAETRGGSLVANRAWAEAGVAATTGAQRGAILQSTSGSGDAVDYTRMVYSDD